jgi:hypothetical protein
VPGAKGEVAMLQFWKFLREHVVAGLGLIVGPFITIGATLNDIYTVVNLGLPPQVWQAIGAFVFFAAVILLLYRFSREQQRTTAQDEQLDKFYAPTVTQSPPKLADSLYVGEIRFSFNRLKDDRHGEWTIRVFNGSGRVVELSTLSGKIKFNAPNSKDPKTTGELPPPSIRTDTAKTVLQLKEWFLILSQPVPSVEADKILAMLDTNTPIGFDLSDLKIEVCVSGKENEKERLPLWGGVSYRKDFGFGRIIMATAHFKA